jgi:BTB/POZ domain-containing protein KCTD9
MYLALLGEARYFQITRLEDWLRNKEYQKAVKIEYSADEFEESHQMSQSCSSDLRYPTWRTEKVYVCPRGIYVHRRNPSACGRSCKKAQGDAEDEFEDEDVLKTLRISKRTILDHGICLRE